MVVPPELSADYAATVKILEKAQKNGEYHCTKKRCGFKDPDAVKFLEHVADHVNEFCISHNMPLIEVIKVNGT